MEPTRDAEEERSKEKQWGGDWQAMGGTSRDGSAHNPHSYIPQRDLLLASPCPAPSRRPPHSISQKLRCLLGSGVSYLLGFLQRIRLVASQPSRGFLCLLCRQKVQFSLDFALQGAESCAETQAMLPTSAPQDRVTEGT